MDVGVMTDFFVHFRDLPMDESDMEFNHTKIPGFGSYRGGSTYKAYGLQMGFHSLEALGLWLAAHGDPMSGGFLMMGTRIAGMATLYTTRFHRKLLTKGHVSRGWIEKLLKMPLSRRAQIKEPETPPTCDNELE
jgi:hypothetical protein